MNGVPTYIILALAVEVWLPHSGELAQQPLPSAPLSFDRAIPITGGRGGHSGGLMLDDVRNRLYVNQMSNGDELDVLGLPGGDVLNRICCIRGFAGDAAGVAIARDTDMLFLNTGQGPPLSIPSPTTFATRLDIAAAPGSQFIALDEDADRIFATSEATPGRSIISAFDLKGRPVFTRTVSTKVMGLGLDPTSHRLLAFLDVGQILLLGLDRGEILAQWNGLQSFSRAAFVVDLPRRRLIQGGDRGQMISIDLATGRALDRITIPSGCDDVAIDHIGRRLFVVGSGQVTGSGGQGKRAYATGAGPSVTVVSDPANAKWSTLGHIAAGDYSEQVAWSTNVARLYLSVPGWNWQPNEIRVFR